MASKTTSRATASHAGVMATPTEAQLQITIMEYLRHALPEGSLAIHVPNGGYRLMSEGRRFKRMGVKAGVLDILIISQQLGSLRPHVVWLEVKSEKGKLSTAQHQMMRLLDDLGCAAYVVRSLEHVEEVLRRENIPIRVRVSWNWRE